MQNRSKIKYPLIFFLIIFTNSLILSQPPCNPDYHGLIFQADKLQSFPPYSLSMPYETLIPYIAMDTLCYYGDFIDTGNFFDRQEYNDTIKCISKYYYHLIDYDPIRFFQARCYKSTSFPVTPRNLEDYILAAVKKVSPYPTLDYALLRANFIAHIYVIDTTGITDTNAVYLGRNLQIVKSIILDTIKGKVIPQGGVVYNCQQKKFDKSFVSGQGGFLQFNYSTDWSRGGDSGLRLLDDNGEPWIKEGREYIVFINAVLECGDSSHLNYCLRPVWPESYTFNMFPVLNGVVQDPENEFGFGTNISVTLFIEKLRQRIDEITSFGVENYSSAEEFKDGIRKLIDDIINKKTFSPTEVYDSELKRYGGINVESSLNKTSDELILSFVTSSNAPVGIDIYNISGLLMSHSRLHGQIPNVRTTTTLNVSNLRSGIYFLQINCGPYSHSGKFFIIR